MAKSKVLKVNRTKKGKPTHCAVKSFAYEFNDFEEIEDREFNFKKKILNKNYVKNFFKKTTLKNFNTKHIYVLRKELINNTEEVCRCLSNLFLGLERVDQIEKRFAAKIQAKLKTRSFTLSIDKNVVPECIAEISTVLAHKIVFLDLGEIIFGFKYF